MRGKRGGRPPTWDGKAIAWVSLTVTMKNPLQRQVTCALWTATMMGQLIHQRFGITLSKASVCRLLGQVGLTPHRPLWRASQKQPEAVERWVTEEYLSIRNMAHHMQAQIFCGDEAGVRSDHHAGPPWAVKGKTPVVSLSTGARCGLTILSAVSAQGAFCFMTVTGRIGASRFLELITRLLDGTDRMICLIVDRHPAHTAQCVERVIETTPIKTRFRLFFLPR